MRVLVISDIDDIHWTGGSGSVDAIFALGDLSDSVIMEAWEQFGAPPAFAVRGNHDVATSFPEGITDLHLRTVDCNGLKLGGFAGAARYKLRGHHQFSQDEATDLLKDFPRVDVFLAHDSPTVHAKNDGVHVGLTAFDQFVREKQPGYFLHGHTHDANRVTQIGQTTVRCVYGYQVLELP